MSETDYLTENRLELQAIMANHSNDPVLMGRTIQRLRRTLTHCVTAINTGMNEPLIMARELAENALADTPPKCSPEKQEN